MSFAALNEYLPVTHEPSFQIKQNPEKQDVDRLRSRLIDFNLAQTGDAKDEPFLVSVTDHAGEMQAGLYAHVYYSWMFVELLWVAEQARGLGYGSRLLAQAEEQACRHGCHSVWLDTFSFQARGFYEKHGYAVFGELPNYPGEHRRYFLAKQLRQEPRSSAR